MSDSSPADWPFVTDCRPVQFVRWLIVSNYITDGERGGLANGERLIRSFPEMEKEWPTRHGTGRADV